MKHFFKKGDIIIIVCALVLCALLFLPRALHKDGDLIAKIYENGELTKEINLSSVTQSYEIKINGAVLLIENGSVSYKEADCPDKTCVGFGSLTKAGDTASCVPNRTVVTVTKKKSNSKIYIITY